MSFVNSPEMSRSESIEQLERENRKLLEKVSELDITLRL